MLLNPYRGDTQRQQQNTIDNLFSSVLKDIRISPCHFYGMYLICIVACVFCSSFAMSLWATWTHVIEIYLNIVLFKVYHVAAYLESRFPVLYMVILWSLTAGWADGPLSSVEVNSFDDKETQILDFW